VVDNRPRRGLLVVGYRPGPSVKVVGYRPPHHREPLHIRIVDTKSTTFFKKVSEKLPPFPKKW